MIRNRRYPDVNMRCYHCGNVLDYVGEWVTTFNDVTSIINTRLKCQRCPCEVLITYELLLPDDEVMGSVEEGSDIDEVDLDTSDDERVNE